MVFLIISGQIEDIIIYMYDMNLKLSTYVPIRGHFHGGGELIMSLSHIKAKLPGHLIIS